MNCRSPWSSVILRGEMPLPLTHGQDLLCVLCVLCGENQSGFPIRMNAAQ